MAVLVWRGQEMRIVSRTMTEVALRLAEPENIAKESVVTVSQAIRREVAAMGDGIERALARASELEVLVHNEVASLERSYTDNELRVRRLIDELVTEREAIVQNAERVRQAIRGSHDSFSADLAGITDQIAVAADSSAKRISDLLAGRSQAITQSIGDTGEQVVNLLATRSDSLFHRLNEAGDKLSDTIINRGDLLVERLNNAVASVSDTFVENSDVLVDRLSRTTGSLSDSFSERAETLLERITVTSESFTDSLLARGDDLLTRLETSSGRTLDAFSQRGVDLVDEINQAGDALSRSVAARGHEATQQMREAGSAFTDAMAAQTQGNRRAPAPGAGPARHHADRPRQGTVDRTVPVGRRQDLQRRHRRRRSAGQRLGKRAEEIVDLVSNQADSTTGRIERAAEIVNTALEARSKAVIEHLGKTGQTVARAMSAQLQEAQAALVIAGDRLDGAGRSVVESLDRQINEAEAILVSANDRLTETGRGVESTLRNAIEMVEGELASAAERFAGIGTEAAQSVGRADRAHRYCGRIPLMTRFGASGERIAANVVGADHPHWRRRDCRQPAARRRSRRRASSAT